MKRVSFLISSFILFIVVLTFLVCKFSDLNKASRVIAHQYPAEWGIKNDGTFKDQYNTISVRNVDMNVTKAWDKFSGGKEVIVAIIDTGIDYTHEDLKDSIWKNKNEIPGDGIDNDNNGFIDDLYGWNFCDNSNITYSNSDNEEH